MPKIFLLQLYPRTANKFLSVVTDVELRFDFAQHSVYGALGAKTNYCEI
jgi:hypothetical protein